MVAETFEGQVKSAVYDHFASTGRRPSVEELAERLSTSAESVLIAYRALAEHKVLVLDSDRRSIRMALPFSGVQTQHVVESGGISYFANCAWDALGIPAALHRPAVVHSRCEQSKEILRMEVGLDGPGISDWWFHCHVPASKWWHDIGFT